MSDSPEYRPQIIRFDSGVCEFAMADRPAFVQGTGKGYWLLIDMETREIIGFRWHEDASLFTRAGASS